ncbi:MAG: helix-turn-helix transcriptional regulator, partial [Candidatus Saccharimonas sp.]
AMINPMQTRRKELGLTQLDIVQRTGLSIGCISQTENGNSTPRARTAALIANALELPVGKLFRKTSSSGRPPLTGKPMALKIQITVMLCPNCFLQLPTAAEKIHGTCQGCGEMYEIPLERS